MAAGHVSENALLSAMSKLTSEEKFGLPWLKQFLKETEKGATF